LLAKDIVVDMSCRVVRRYSSIFRKKEGSERDRKREGEKKERGREREREGDETRRDETRKGG